MTAPSTAAAMSDATDWDITVAAFLRAHPGWLAEHPELYRALAPPARVHGEALADHMTAMVLHERRHAKAMAEQTLALVVSKRATMAAQARVHEAVLALIGADDLDDYVTVDLPRLLSVDVACLWRRSDRTLPVLGRLEALLGCRDVVFRTAPADAARLYREAAALARHDVLIRLPTMGVLGLASRDKLCAEPADMQADLNFLGKAIARALQW